MELRDEEPGDSDAIHALTAAAFGGEVEARIVELARERGEITWSIVAEESGAITGHVMLSPLHIEPEVGRRCLALGPISVAPSRQRQGIGAALMREAIRRARECGYHAILLLGDPGYYRRFGFTTAPVGNEYGADEAFMARELVAGSLANATHSVARYVSAFADAERRGATTPDTRQ